MQALSEEEHKKIETYFSRDNLMYTDFEKACKGFYKKHKHEKYTSRLMIRECELRAHENFDLMREKIFNGLEPYEYYQQKQIEKPSFNPLVPVREITLLRHYRSIAKICKFYDPKQKKKPKRTSSTRLGSIYQNDRSQYYLSIGEQYTVDNFDYAYPEDPVITKKELKNLKVQHVEFMEKQDDIGIKHLSNIPILFDRDGRLLGQSDKVALVELDFSLSEKILVERIHQIKDYFNNNPDRIQSLTEFLKLKPKSEIRMKNKIGSYRSRSLARKYTDMLFIYDCHRLGLSPQYSLYEINEWNKNNPENRYTGKSKDPNNQEEKKVKLNEMDKKTYIEYLTLMFELIKNHKK